MSNTSSRQFVVRFVLLLMVVVLACPVVANDNADGVEGQDPRNYSLSVALGYVSISGNAQSTSGNLKATWKWKKRKWTWSAGGSFVFSDVTDMETGEETRSMEKYQLAFKTGYAMWEKGGLFGNISWLKNEPAGIRENLSLATGFSRAFMADGPLKLDGGLGLEGYRETRIQPEGDVEAQRMAAYLQVQMVWKINTHNELKFENESRMSLSNSEDFRLASNLAYHSSINSRFAVEIAYEHQYKNFPVVGKGTTDTTTTVNLVYKF